MFFFLLEQDVPKISSIFSQKMMDLVGFSPSLSSEIIEVLMIRSGRQQWVLNRVGDASGSSSGSSTSATSASPSGSAIPPLPTDGPAVTLDSSVFYTVTCAFLFYPWLLSVLRHPHHFPFDSGERQTRWV